MAYEITEALEAREKKVRTFIDKYAKSFGIQADVVRALITQESRFDGNAVSPTRAYGFGQFTTIAAAQVKEIAKMPDCPDTEGLVNFQKQDADEPDLGIKAVCATLWWLLYKKYNTVRENQVRLEAALTFYNAGGKAAQLVIQHGGHAAAVEDLKRLPDSQRSQSVVYAKEVLKWLIAWHDHFQSETAKASVPTTIVEHPFKTPAAVFPVDLEVYRALVEALKALGKADDRLDVAVVVKDGKTEVSILIAGELH